MKDAVELARDSMTPDSFNRAMVDGKRQLLVFKLHELRKQLGIAQADLASTLGVTQPTISELEGRPDMLLSTLSKYLGGIGAELELIVKMPDGKKASIDLFV